MSSLVFSFVHFATLNQFIWNGRVLVVGFFPQLSLRTRTFVVIFSHIARSLPGRGILIQWNIEIVSCLEFECWRFQYVTVERWSWCLADGKLCINIKCPHSPRRLSPALRRQLRADTVANTMKTKTFARQESNFSNGAEKQSEDIIKCVFRSQSARSEMLSVKHEVKKMGPNEI